MKFLLLGTAVAVASTGIWLSRSAPLPDPVAVVMPGTLPAPTPLTSTPRARFTPTPASRRGYYNLDIVGDFTAPATKKLIFAAAGRNLHVQQDRTKLFRRGFSAVEQGRMVPNEEIWFGENPPNGWQSKLTQQQRAVILYRPYFRDAFSLPWGENGNLASTTPYRAPARQPSSRQNIYQAGMELRGGCVGFNDCPPSGMISTFGTLILDIENDDVNADQRQETVNLYTYLAKTIKENVSPQTELGSVSPIPHYGVGYSQGRDYTDGPTWFWSMKARQTATSRERGMPDAIVGKSIVDYLDFQMPGSYYVYADFDYGIDHNDDRGRHWLAALLSEQEVNGTLSPKKRMAWQWLFNTQSGSFSRSAKAENAAPPAIAEGMAVFYWFTGAYGVVFWDDHVKLTPDQPTPTDPAQRGLGDNRNYACYEHYVHGLWRLFKHHSDLFNGRETYLNEKTECSYDGGKTWFTYNASQLKTQKVPFVRAIVNGDQILVAATQPYARPEATGSVMLRYVQNGYQFYTTIPLRGDEIYIGRATMRK